MESSLRGFATLSLEMKRRHRSAELTAAVRRARGSVEPEVQDRLDCLEAVFRTVVKSMRVEDRAQFLRTMDCAAQRYVAISHLENGVPALQRRPVERKELDAAKQMVQMCRHQTLTGATRKFGLSNDDSQSDVSVTSEDRPQRPLKARKLSAPGSPCSERVALPPFTRLVVNLE
mmetsp:Transcript_1599/g.4223  ORF Transcript_1599/g.4223 Transcript_1599/m.4223 type:complete len:174 (-) Transcript_1599:25-546(-)